MEKVKKLCNYLQSDYGLIGIDEKLVEKAMTTKTYTKERIDKGELTSSILFDYQELELIGDKVIGLVVAEYLLLMGIETEGNLTTTISSVVDNENLKQVSHKMGLYNYVLRNDNQEIVDTKVESDIFESLVGALYYSVGFLTTKSFIIKTLFGDVKSQNYVHDNSVETNRTETKNIFEIALEEANNKRDLSLDQIKNTLQEYCQKRGLSIPTYEVTDKKGQDHRPEFTVVVYVNGEHLGTGINTSKKAAEKLAAAEAMKRITE